MIKNEVPEDEVSKTAEDIARFIIESGLVLRGEGEFWLINLRAEVAFEAGNRGYENANEIAEEAVRIYRERLANNP
jgi:hypothetical protein